MSNNWYPIIDYSICDECGTCIKKCTHGVYDKNKFPTPVVVYKEGCIEGCKGCGNLCPKEAISYVGDKSIGNSDCSCSCGGNC